MIEHAEAVVRTLLEVNGQGWPFCIAFGSGGAYISNIVNRNHSMGRSIFVSLNSFETSAWNMAVGEAVIKQLNAEYKAGKRDFTEDYVQGVIRQFERTTPYVPGPRPPPKPPREKPPTPEEKKGAELVQLLQKMGGIDEPFEKALSGWRGMSDNEKESTRNAARLFGAKQAKHRLN